MSEIGVLGFVVEAESAIVGVSVRDFAPTDLVMLSKRVGVSVTEIGALAFVVEAESAIVGVSVTEIGVAAVLNVTPVLDTVVAVFPPPSVAANANV